MTRSLRVFMIAGELSGDQLGAHLMEGLRQLRPDIEMSGVGGPQMTAAGLSSLFDMSELSVMGIVEVLPKLPHLLTRIREVANHVIAMQPDILITIDSPDFCLRVAKRVKASLPQIPVAHYVAPSVWAWRPGRAEKMAAHVDHVLALLPFEPAYMHAAGMTCDFVGHPVANFPVIDRNAAAEFRVHHRIAAGQKLLCVLPGSRKSEVANHTATFRAVLGQLATRHPGLRTVIPVASSVSGVVTSGFEDAPTQPILLRPNLEEKLTAYAASDAALAVSGTVSLELASQATPMVIAYTASAVSQWIIRRKFLLDTATLVNLVSETRTVPEFIFENFKSDLITDNLSSFLDDPKTFAAQLDASGLTMTKLGRGGAEPGLRAAHSILDRFA